MQRRTKKKTHLPGKTEAIIWLLALTLAVKAILSLFGGSISVALEEAAKHTAVPSLLLATELCLSPQEAAPLPLSLACNPLYLSPGAYNLKHTLDKIGEELPPVPTKEDAPPPQEEPSAAEEVLQIKPITLAASATGSYLGTSTVAVNNQSKHTNLDIPYLLARPLSFSYQKGKSKILIVHTHGTESYSPEGAITYTNADSTRSNDSSQTVIAVGDVIERVLTAYGYTVIHDRTPGDAQGFNDAYPNTLKIIEKNMKEHPDINIVLDIHRDSMITTEGLKYKPITEYNGKSAAQIMLVMGSDTNLKHEHFKENLKFALKVQDEMNSRFPNLARPLILSKQRYNQHMTRGSMIVEVGSCGNTLSEAKYGAELFANALAYVLDDMH